MNRNRNVRVSGILPVLTMLMNGYPNLSLASEESCKDIFVSVQNEYSMAPINQISTADLAEIHQSLYPILSDSGLSREQAEVSLKNNPQWPKIKGLLEKLSTTKNELREILSQSNEFRKIRGKIHLKYRDLLVKVMADPQYNFSEKEMDLINRHKTLGLRLESARRFAIENDNVASMYSSLIRLHKGIFWTMLIGAITIKSEILAGAAAPANVDENALTANQIEIIYLSPAPHTEIRIGNTIYNYGPGSITKMTYEDSMLLNNTAFYRSSTRVRLNLNDAELSQLIKYLEGEVGKYYSWIPNYPSPTGFLCVAASHRAIEKNTSIMVPAGIDRSPILSEAYFAGRYFLGDPKVEGVYYSSSGQLDPFFDLGAGVIDSNIGLQFLWINALAAQADYLPNSIRLSK